MTAINNQIYDQISATWWEEDGFMAVLRTAVNPPRAAYFKRVLTQLNIDVAKLHVLDVGCGGGLLSEEFASFGCQVSAVDQSAPTLAAARAHAQKMNLVIDYQQASAEQLPFASQRFDVVCCCDVLEHVASVEVVIKELARVIKPGGIFLFDTINRTFASKLFAIKIAQDWWLTRFMPRNVHVWEQFIRPQELTAVLTQYEFSQVTFVGLSANPNPLPAALALMRRKLDCISYSDLGEKLKLQESQNLSIAYMGFAVKALQQ